MVFGLGSRFKTKSGDEKSMIKKMSGDGVAESASINSAEWRRGLTPTAKTISPRCWDSAEIRDEDDADWAMVFGLG